MDKIASGGIKVDLHIHSVYSNGKDGKKVSVNTLENLPVLIKGLTENGVNMCAITDHDIFNYELYAELKKEEAKDNCIDKVLPGIEFSVEFMEDKIIHIITIFDDKDDEKVKNIEDVMINGKGAAFYKKTKQAYTKNEYFEILSDIDVDFIMIAHQKNTPSSKKNPQPHDVMSLGETAFNELVFMDYFDAYEFRNKKHEIYNKIFIIENNVEEKLRFITGSDCHQWEYYPQTEKGDNREYKYTYIKALPTFKGLAMAVTDTHRIELENAFFNPNAKYVPQLIVEINEREINIPLSRGLNVIIGDNSIGKSLFLHEITNNYKTIASGVRKGYDKFLERNSINFKNHINESEVFQFHEQGEIRKIFDSDGLKPDKYLLVYYPEAINADKYRAIAESELQKLFDGIVAKFNYDNDISKLPIFEIPENEAEDKSITFLDNIKKKETKELQNLVDQFEKITRDLQQLSKNENLSERDKDEVKSSLEIFRLMSEKYVRRLNDYKKENEKINIFGTFINDYKIAYSKKITAEQSKYSNYLEQKKFAIESMISLLQRKQSLKRFSPNILETDVIPETNPVDKYRFVSKIQGPEKINNDYITKLIKEVLKQRKDIDTLTITEGELKNIISKYPSDDEKGPLSVLKEKLNVKLDNDFKVKNTIIEENMDVYDEVSSGFDAQMYFTLLCGETRDKGIYIVDQPEDHISQRAIKEKVIDQFRRMGMQRQVIMVTHNPQFIVNLDVDNVIFLSKENGEYTIQSGALEYENENYSILRIVADNIEGGLQTIQGRMKRYEKNT